MGVESIIAVAGGLFLGTGLGIFLGRGSQGGVRRELTAHKTALSTTVIPVLEQHADALELPENERCREISDPIRLVVALSTSIRRHQERENLPFSDTLDVAVTGDLLKRESED